MTRNEILPGVFLNCLQETKFKTAQMSVFLLAQMQRETASMNALIPAVLRRGTTHYYDIEALSRRLDELYGTEIEPAIRKVGEIQCTGFESSWPESAFLPECQNVTAEAISLVCEMLLSPATRGGLLLSAYVDSERDNLADVIRGRINDKRSYAHTRCIEEMCCHENFAVGKLGSTEDCESINYKKLTKQYRNLLQTAPIEIFYVGQEKEKYIATCLKDALRTLPRGEIDFEIGTDIRMNALEAEPRFLEEKMDVTQAKLVMGFRLGEWMEEPNKPALSVFGALYGNGATSKLFLNVREKMQLCYYVYASHDVHKGIMTVSAGIDTERFEDAKNEILLQLEKIKNGEFTAEELATAKALVKSDLKALRDSQDEIITFCLGNTLDGTELTTDEYSELTDEVTREDIAALAESIEPDMIYLLKGGEEDSLEEAE